MKEKDTGFLILASTVAALGGLLFGFDTAVISGTTPYLQPYFGLNDIALGWTVSSLLIGCIIGVVSSGKPSDILGRRKTLLIAAFLFLVSAIGSALSVHLAVFVAFRVLGGIAVGTASMLSPMYISEIAPAEKRGMLVSLNQLAIVVGILFAFFSNYLLAGTGPDAWRWMLAVMGAPALLFFVALLIVPESPRWLMQKNRRNEAFDILKRINGEKDAMQEISSIEASIATENNGTYRELFKPNVRPVLWIGILLAVFSQVTGINSIMYYAPVIFKEMGLATDSALVQTITIGGINFLFTLVAIRWIDRWGRKKLLIGGSLGMFVSLAVVTVAFFMKKFDGYLILIFILTFIASFAASIGPVSWVVISEVFPNKLRSKAMSLAIVALWISCFLVSLSFPVMLNRLGGGAAFLIFGILCFVMMLYVTFRIPETKGKSLEELEKILVK